MAVAAERRFAAVRRLIVAVAEAREARSDRARARQTRRAGGRKLAGGLVGGGGIRADRVRGVAYAGQVALILRETRDRVTAHAVVAETSVSSRAGVRVVAGGA